MDSDYEIFEVTNKLDGRMNPKLAKTLLKNHHHPYPKSCITFKVHTSSNPRQTFRCATLLFPDTSRNATQSDKQTRR